MSREIKITTVGEHSECELCGKVAMEKIERKPEWLGDSANRCVCCPHDELNEAYKKGKRDRKQGKTLKDNPYPSIPSSPSRGQYPHGAWVRGWLSVNAERLPNKEVEKSGGDQK